MPKEMKNFVVVIGEMTSRVKSEDKMSALVKVLKNKKIVTEKISVGTPPKKKIKK